MKFHIVNPLFLLAKEAKRMFKTNLKTRFSSHKVRKCSQTFLLSVCATFGLSIWQVNLYLQLKCYINYSWKLHSTKISHELGTFQLNLIHGHFISVLLCYMGKIGF